MTDRDLTPEEARAEVEAFLGPEWKIVIDDDGETFAYVLRAFNSYVGIEVPSDTLRAAVSALKDAWRDAVRPWVVAGAAAAYNDVDRYGNEQQGLDEIVYSVLKEDDK